MHESNLDARWQPLSVAVEDAVIYLNESSMTLFFVVVLLCCKFAFLTTALYAFNSTLLLHVIC